VAISREILKEILSYGVMAPSGDNSQPWDFRMDGDNLLIINNELRDTSLFNVNKCAAFIACGALIENISIAALTKGYAIHAELFPEGGAKPIVAKITFTEAKKHEDKLFAYIDKRCTNRGSFKGKPLDINTVKKLTSITGENYGELTLVEDRATIKKIAQVASLNDRLLFENKKLHDFLFDHIRWTKKEIEETKDGMDIDTLGLFPIEKQGFGMLSSWPLVRFMNCLGMSRMLPIRSSMLYKSASAFGLLQMPGKTPEDFVKGGRTLQRIWLTVTSEGLSFQPTTGITFLIQRLYMANGSGLSTSDKKIVEAAEARLKQLLPTSRDKAIVMLFRIGQSRPPKAYSLRRTVSIE
jgi:hypothetical protein